MAKEKLGLAEQVKPGSAAYNLACLNAVKGDVEACRHWLEKSSQLGTLPGRETLLNDPDLQSVREHDWFKKLLEEGR